MLDSPPESFSAKPMTENEITRFSSRDALINGAINTCYKTLGEAIKKRGQGVFLGAGGSTPGPVYRGLSQKTLDWDKITIGLTDERWVPLSDPASNEALMRATLHQNKAAAATLLPMVTNASKPPVQEVPAVNALYADAARACDIMILGMGADAHTLSWFPEADGLRAALDPENQQMVCAVEAKQSAVTGKHTKRMTLTLPAIKHAKHIILLITGDEKLAVLEDSAPNTPIRHMIHVADDRLAIYWSP